MLSKQGARAGRLASEKTKTPNRAGWAFEFRNDFLSGRRRHRVLCSWRSSALKYPDPQRMEGANTPREFSGLLSMQNRDGGWGAFDRDNDQKLPLQHSFR